MPANVSFDFDWLLDKPPDVAVVFAARMALRVAPLLAGLQGLRGGSAGDFGEDIALPAFRSMAASWIAGQCPAHGDVMADAVADAGDAAYGVAQHAASAAARCAAAAAGDAAAAAYGAASGDPNTGPMAVRACIAAVEATRLADFAAAARADSETIDDNGGGVSALAALALWPAEQPDWAPEAWQRLAEALLKENGDWQVWTSWYRARLEGGSVNKALEVARVLIADDIWSQGPRVVNAEIARLVAEHGKAER